MDEGQTVTEYARRADISPSLMTRYLADLGAVNRYHEEGFGLVEHFPGANDKRFRFVRLTPKGRGVVGQIVRALAR
jgi:DNA-binding MarR family transcriptional regulator